MTTKNLAPVVKDFADRTILVSREFAAPLTQVWRAYTESIYLDQWWGPAPWRAQTKHLNFVAGGYWHYAMVGPDNERHWGRMSYLAIDHHRRIQVEDAFCDEHGTVNPALPVSRGQILFTATPIGTRVEFSMTYATEADLQRIVDMGFEQGIFACFEQLEALLRRVPS